MKRKYNDSFYLSEINTDHRSKRSNIIQLSQFKNVRLCQKPKILILPHGCLYSKLTAFLPFQNVASLTENILFLETDVSHLK